MYLVVRKKGEPIVCGSIKAVSQETGINVNTLYYQLSRKKKDRYQIDEFIILKTKVVRSKK